MKWSLNTNTFLLQTFLQSQVQGHLISKSFGPLMKIWEYFLQCLYIWIDIMSTCECSLLCYYD